MFSFFGKHFCRKFFNDEKNFLKNISTRQKIFIHKKFFKKKLLKENLINLKLYCYNLITLKKLIYLKKTNFVKFFKFLF